MSCLPIGTMSGLSYAQYQKYNIAVNIFKRVETYNLNVQTLRAAGNKTLAYYEFDNAEEEKNYKLGRFVLTQNDPVGAAAGSYIPVKKT
jgi:hypothetical protein